MKYDVWVFFENLSIKVIFTLKYDKNNGIFHEDIL